MELTYTCPFIAAPPAITIKFVEGKHHLSQQKCHLKPWREKSSIEKQAGRRRRTWEPWPFWVCLANWRCLSAFNTLELGKLEDDLLSHSVHQRGWGSRGGDKAAQQNERMGKWSHIDLTLNSVLILLLISVNLVK